MQAFIFILILAFSLMASLVIHEFGHFFMARILRVNVKEYCIGLGPKLFTFKTKKSMRITIKAIPIAAYVILDSVDLRKMYLYKEPSRHRTEMLEELPEGLKTIETTTYKKSILIFFGGIFFNLLAFAILTIIAQFTVISDTNYGLFIIDWFSYLGNMLIFSPSQSGSLLNASAGIVWSPGTFHYYLDIFINLLIAINLTTALFNLLPLPPLDGFKILSRSVEEINGKRFDLKTRKIISYVTLILMVYFIVAVVVSDIRSFAA